MHTRLMAERFFAGWAMLVLACLSVQPSMAKDYFLTIGGGYNPGGNQASLEANVLFFNQVLRECHASASSQAVFFADGLNEQADLQIVKPETLPHGPLSELLKQLHARGNSPEVEYRNHQVPNIAGPISPRNIENSLRRSAAAMQPGDRLLVYVTAHGEPSTSKNKYNTLISCWDDEKISAKVFSGWLDSVPAGVPIVLVMAQCYCGGFANTIFNNVDGGDGPSTRSVCGFFAQQHDLAAAGCRPDLENEEEYSSFFWGAFAGRSRNGREMLGVDCNHDGRISFAEAHANAIVVSETIDIPLRTSDVLLRRFSRIPHYEHRGMPRPEEENPPQGDSQAVEGNGPELESMQGSLQSFIERSSPDVQRILRELSQQLGLDLEADVSSIFETYSQHQKLYESLRQTQRRGRRERSSGRRQLREEIGERWQDLADRSAWRSSALLGPESQHEILHEIEQLPSYERTMSYLRGNQERTAKLDATEIRDVKFQRLIQTLEGIVLASNLPKVAEHSLVDRYQEMLAQEESFLDAKSTP